MISTKGWRRIVVDNNSYYWQVRDFFVEDNSFLETFRPTLIIRLAHLPASSCSIFFSQEGYHWLGYSRPSLIITPKLVAYSIRWALNKGWNPTTKKPFQVENGAELWDNFSTENESKL